MKSDFRRLQHKFNAFNGLILVPRVQSEPNIFLVSPILTKNFDNIRFEP